MLDALRALFTELEFTSLLKELVPVMEVRETEYRELKSAKELKALAKARKARWRLRSNSRRAPRSRRRRTGRRADQKSGDLLFDAAATAGAERPRAAQAGALRRAGQSIHRRRWTTTKSLQS